MSRDDIVRIHAQPREELCHPNKIREALMPRRLKYRCTYMVDEPGHISTAQDKWVRKGKKPINMKSSWTGFTVFCSQPVNLEVLASA